MMPTLSLLVVAGLFSPQGRIVDQGVFVVTRQGAMIGREQFTVRQARTSDGTLGLIVSVRASYPHPNPAVELAPVVELRSDSLPVVAHFDVVGTTSNRFVILFGPRRVTLRSESPNREGAREFPPSPRGMVVDDSVFSLYTVLPGSSPGPIHLFYPRNGTRVAGSIRRVAEPVAVGDGSGRLTHLVVDSGRDERHLWYDENGRLVKVEVPALDVVATRITNR